MRAHELELAFTMHRERVDMANHRFWVSATGEPGPRRARWRGLEMGSVVEPRGRDGEGRRAGDGAPMPMDGSMVPGSAVLRTAEVSRCCSPLPSALACQNAAIVVASGCAISPPRPPMLAPSPSASLAPATGTRTLPAQALADPRRPTTPTSRRSARSASPASRPPRTRQQQRTRRAARPRSPSSTATGRLARARARRRGCARGGATCGMGSSCRPGFMLRGGGRGCVDRGMHYHCLRSDGS